MIEQLEIEPTYKSPRVNFDPQNGIFKIEGSSILVNVENFYEPLFNWMDEFVENPTAKNLRFIFDIEYTNMASTKRFLLFLYKLKKLVSNNIEVSVDWNFVENDKYVLEVGKDISQMLDLPFNFIPHEKNA